MPIPDTSWPPVTAFDVFHIEAVVGKFQKRLPDTEDWEDVTGAVCTETDTVRGIVTFTVHDSQPPTFPESRTAVMQVRAGLLNPNDVWQEEPENNYFMNDHNDTNGGSWPTIIVTPERGVDSEYIFYFHDPLIVGTWKLYASADAHFLLNVNTVLDWTLVALIEVVHCEETKEPLLHTTPQPPNPIEGDMISDLANLSEGELPTGTITFQLWDGPDSENPGSMIYEEIVDVDSGNGTYESQEVGPMGEFEGHWKVIYSGDDLHEPVTSEDEPVVIVAKDQNPQGTDLFVFDDSSDEEERGRFPGIAKFQQEDAKQLWFCRTTPGGSPVEVTGTVKEPFVLGDIAIGGQHAQVEIMKASDQTTTQIIDQIDDAERPMPYVMGVTFRVPTGDLYTALTPEETMDYTPHDIDWIPDDSGLLVAVVPSLGVLEFRKYDFDGVLQTTWTVPTEPGWFKQTVKIAVACDARTVFYTMRGHRIMRFDIVSGLPLSDYHFLLAGSGYLYGGIRTLPRELGDNRDVMVALTVNGTGPQRALTLDPVTPTKHWVDEVNPPGGVYKIKQRSNATGIVTGVEHTVALTPDGKTLSLAAWADFCHLRNRLGWVAVQA